LDFAVHSRNPVKMMVAALLQVSRIRWLLDHELRPEVTIE
jgi:hypothetical protein